MLLPDALGMMPVSLENNSSCNRKYLPYISVEGMTEDGKVLVNE